MSPDGPRDPLRARATRSARYVFDRLPESARRSMRHGSTYLSGLDQLKRNQAALARRLAELEQRLETASPSAPVADDRFPPEARSRVCTQEQVQSGWYAEWCARLGEPAKLHRKVWEHAYVARAADALGVVGPGARGLGFGVGREPLVAYFAGRGCTVQATDLAPDAEAARVWENTGQHTSSLDGLARTELCAPEDLRARVSFRPVDMRDVPDDLTGFDFCWSSCALEHLGSLQAGLDFVDASLRTLRPGGIALHTTELTLSSDDETITAGPTVLYRRRDLVDLVERLEAAGHQVAALDLDPGSGALDEHVDLPPYVDDPHLRLWHQGHVVTSVALIIRVGG